MTSGIGELRSGAFQAVRNQRSLLVSCDIIFQTQLFYDEEISFIFFFLMQKKALVILAALLCILSTSAMSSLGSSDQKYLLCPKTDCTVSR